MRDQILALFAATAFGLAPAWTGASEDLKGNSRTDEAAASRPAPSWEELAHATYTGIEEEPAADTDTALMLKLMGFADEQPRTVEPAPVPFLFALDDKGRKFL